MGERVMYQERKGAAGRPSTYLYLPSCSAFRSVDLSDGKGGVEGVGARMVGWAREVFLPQGYPESVSPDYLHYQFWDSMQAYCSSIAGALSLQATLIGLGVGEGTATPLAATLSWLLKDGSGMVASIAFAYWKGTQLDCNSKQWRLFADVTNDLNSLLRLVGPALPVPFLLVLCVSGLLAALVGVAGGSTRAALAVHQARCDNMADISAKDGSQETLVNLAALVTNLTLLPYFTATLSTTWVTFLTCVSLHLLANHRAMRALTLASLNRPRLLHLLSCWAVGGASPAAVPSPADANLAEPLLFGPAFITDYFPHGFRVSIGCSLHWALQRCGGDPGVLYKAASGAFKGQRYMVSEGGGG
uniref:Protein root UVB sensitive/RUS domain-containing protein n=1 Tax=Scylla olivacea TaxID=85551 RepID=A0A0P4W9P0_SCYOL